MKYLFLLSAFFFFSQINVFPQGCLPEGIFIDSQEQIDSFQANYPGCTEIEGNLIIANYGATPITNLNGLSVLTRVGGILDLANNNSLISLSGFENITTIGSFLSIKYHNNLTSLEGLNNLDSVGEGIFILENNALTNMTGLDNLVFVGSSFEIWQNQNLVNLNGLESLTSIGAHLSILSNHNLLNLTGLENLMTLGFALEIGNNHNLKQITGLQGLTSVEGPVSIYLNSNLQSFIGLNNLTQVGGFISIHQNSALSCLSGLENISPDLITSIGISWNPNLSNCDVQSICEYLVSPNCTIIIHDNAPGCNSQEEVQAACLTSVEDNFINDEITLFPNPATSFITINVSGGQPIVEAIIYNHLGQKALEALPVNNTVDVSALKPGIYFLEVITSESRAGTKLLVE